MILLASMMVIGMIGVVVLDRASRERFLQRRVIEAQRRRSPGSGRSRTRSCGRSCRARSWRASASGPRRSPSASTRRPCSSPTSSGSPRWRSASAPQRTADPAQRAGQPLGRPGRGGRRGEDQDDRRRVLRGSRRARAAGRPRRAGRATWRLAMIRATAEIGRRARRAARDPGGRPLRPGGGRRHRQDEVQLRPVGRHGERREPPRSRAASPARSRRARPRWRCWGTRSRSSRGARWTSRARARCHLPGARALGCGATRRPRRPAGPSVQSAHE